VLWYQCGVLVCNRPVSVFRFPVGSRNTKPGTRPKNNKSHYISIKTYTTGPKLCNTSQLYLSIPLFYLMWGNTHFSMFSFLGSEKAKTENARPQNNKSHYISIKTQGTGPKLCNTSQLYLSIPLFYLMWGNTHFSMFSFLGSEKAKTENARPQNNKSHYISIKTQGTGPKLYNTSQSYLLIPIFYPMRG